MKQPGYLVLMAGLLFVGCNKKAETPPAKASKPATSSGNPLTAPVDYLGAVANAQKHAIKTIDTVSLNRHIDLFHEQEERYPTNLNELIAKRYITSLPAPPYGMKFKYDPQMGKVQVVKQ